MSIGTKICGIRAAEDARVAGDAGAAFLGFIHFPKSPRHISLEEAKALEPSLPPLPPHGPARVGVFVNADDATIASVANALRLTHIQLHGRETPERVLAVKETLGLSVIKAIAVSTREEVEQARAYAQTADILLFDAKPPAGSELPGGNAVSFPWDILRGTAFDIPVLMAGGLTPKNAQDALAESGADGLDVSSGVESEPGIKSQALIRAFLSAAKSAS